MLEKGGVVDSLTYGSSGEKFAFPKTGKEIAGKLLGLAVTINKQEAELTAKMDLLEEEIGESPDSENASYSLKSVKVPRYSYDYYSKPCLKEEVPVIQQSDIEHEKTLYQLCQQYNDLSYRLMGLKEDLESIRVITENIEPGKKYMLSVGQLSSLGF